MNRSIATVEAPEFINLKPTDLNPLMSSCDIKVCYTGLNANKTFLSEEKLTEFAKTLRGCPIVGYYQEKKEDFSTHGKVLSFDDDGLHLEVKTRPYGFVAPDSPVWYKTFTDIDDSGKEVVRKYLMCKGYIWDGQYPEAKLITEEGRPQSMEFDNNEDRKNYSGTWTNDFKNNSRFFIINDAVFSKLCVLGDDVEPAMWGASVTPSDEDYNFTEYTLDSKKFTKSLFAMMQQLQYALQKQGGQSNMAEVNTTPDNVQPVENEQKAPTPDFQAETANQPETKVEAPATEEQPVNEPAPAPDFEKKEEEKKEDSKEEEKKEDSKEDSKEEDSKEKEEEKKEKKDYALLSEQYEALQTQFEELQKQYQSLANFKAEIENQQKDALIGQFYMLSDEDKKDVIEHKTDYSLDDIKAKLSVICFEKKVNFDSNKPSENQENMTDNNSQVTTYTLENGDSDLPDWVKAVKANMNN